MVCCAGALILVVDCFWQVSCFDFVGRVLDWELGFMRLFLLGAMGCFPGMDMFVLGCDLLTHWVNWGFDILLRFLILDRFIGNRGSQG